METSLLIIITYYLNCLLGITDRVLQICYYIIAKKEDEFKEETADKMCLTFIVLPFGFNFFIILFFCLFHYEEKITFLTKIKSFFLYLISTELLFPIGIQISFKTKYSENADNPLVTMKLLNAIHIIFISIPQILIISVNSSAKGEFTKLDIASLVISAIFAVWSIVYYFLCIIKEVEYDNYITSIAYNDHYE